MAISAVLSGAKPETAGNVGLVETIVLKFSKNQRGMEALAIVMEEGEDQFLYGSEKLIAEKLIQQSKWKSYTNTFSVQSGTLLQNEEFLGCVRRGYVEICSTYFLTAKPSVKESQYGGFPFE